MCACCQLLSDECVHGECLLHYKPKGIHVENEKNEREKKVAQKRRRRRRRQQQKLRRWQQTLKFSGTTMLYNTADLFSLIHATIICIARHSMSSKLIFLLIHFCIHFNSHKIQNWTLQISITKWKRTDHTVLLKTIALNRFVRHLLCCTRFLHSQPHLIE